MEAKKYKTVASYIADFDGQARARIDELRKIIQSVIPDAEEVISYNMPSYKLAKVVCYFAGYKNHIGFYPTPKPIIAFAKELTKYKTSKGAIQFPLDKPIPKLLVKKIVKFRLSIIF
ncbi:MAG: hypothetical protein RL596_1635 [Bacteroidota bacterium]|jgi:uncharacterized protein YdhG (YjbR/CyaY superfamily)